MDLSTKKNEVPLDLRVEKDVSFCHLRSKTNKFLRYVCNFIKEKMILDMDSGVVYQQKSPHQKPKPDHRDRESLRPLGKNDLI